MHQASVLFRGYAAYQGEAEAEAVSSGFRCGADPLLTLIAVY
jgi:hypothetical protein